MAMGEWEAQTHFSDLLTSHPDTMLIKLPQGKLPTRGAIRKCLASYGIEDEITAASDLVVYVIVWERCILAQAIHIANEK